MRQHYCGSVHAVLAHAYSTSFMPLVLHTGLVSASSFYCAMGLLKGIPPLLTADMLYVLRSMGHGDKIAIVDCLFPRID